MTRILICDDDQAWAAALEAGIRTRLEFEVTVAPNPKHASAMLRSTARRKSVENQFSVVVVDLDFRGDGTPDTKGFSILEAVSEDPFLEAVVCTGTGNEDKACTAIQLGAFRYIKKTDPSAEPMAEIYGAIDEAVQSRNSVVKLFNAIQALREEAPSDSKLVSLASDVYQCILKSRHRRIID